MARLAPLAAYAAALGSRRVLAGVLNDLGTATYRAALTLEERDAVRVGWCRKQRAHTWTPRGACGDTPGV
jgi:hypothetical protein